MVTFRKPRSLHRRITLWLLAFASALTIAMVAQGTVVIEYVERVVWKSLLTVELDHFIQRSRDEPGYRWDDTSGFVVYAGADDPDLPPALRGLDEGLHDDLQLGDTSYVVLVRDDAGTRYTLAMDIEQFAIDESRYELLTVLAAALLLLAIGLATALGVSHLLRPLSRLAQRIGAMQPEQGTERIELEPGAGSELVVIADAFNGYLQRNAQFVERERTFINTASHELRTPVAVINGAAELALQANADPATMQRQLQRIQRSAKEMEQLIVLLLALAKDPARLARISKPLALDALLPEIMLTGFKVEPIPFIGDQLDAVMPRFITEGMNVQFYFGGTSLLIIVGVAMDTVQQVESQLIMRHYDGFMKKTRIRGRRGQ